jgi:hypothetical protein
MPVIPAIKKTEAKDCELEAILSKGSQTLSQKQLNERNEGVEGEGGRKEGKERRRLGSTKTYSNTHM